MEDWGAFSQRRGTAQTKAVRRGSQAGREGGGRAGGHGVKEKASSSWVAEPGHLQGPSPKTLFPLALKGSRYCTTCHFLGKWLLTISPGANRTPRRLHTKAPHQPPTFQGSPPAQPCDPVRLRKGQMLFRSWDTPTYLFSPLLGPEGS